MAAIEHVESDGVRFEEVIIEGTLAWPNDGTGGQYTELGWLFLVPMLAKFFVGGKCDFATIAVPWRRAARVLVELLTRREVT